MIYDQYYLMSLGLPVSWTNPDIAIFQNGVEVSPSDLTAATTYQVVARIWNGSTDAPVAGLPLSFSYLSFGIGTQSNPIGETAVNLGVLGGPDQPAFATMDWTTPATPGHYCIQVLLMPASDSNWSNNLGQENTHVALAQSPASTSFQLRNDTRLPQRYRFQADGYTIPELPPCPPELVSIKPDLASRVAAVQQSAAGTEVPLPEGWSVIIDPQTPTLDPAEEITVNVTIEPPDTFAGTEVVNIHAFRIPARQHNGVPVLAGGVTFNVTKN
jgi:hypothetical protein